MQYRSEIDGLRALAVVPVVLFHAGFAVPGGYLGVDVFFVISGYLITALLWDEMREGRFSLWQFYARRVRRLLPALFAMLAVTTAVAWVLLAPEDLVRYGRSLVAVAGISSNMLFWLGSGYFDAASELKPLLHTWSLAVEEQFYLLFPFVLLLGLRLGRGGLLALLGLLACASFAGAQVLLAQDASAAFYLLPARAWELLAGAVVALALHRGALGAAAPWAQVLSVTGLGLIVLSMAVFDTATPVPGPATLLPVLGTALVLAFARPGTWVARLLSLRLLVGLGLISYSTYLWHHPLFAFARYGLGHDPGPWIMGGLALASFALGWLSWVLIETPFRRAKRWRMGSPLKIAGSGALVTAVLGGAAVVSDGLLRPVPDSYQRLMASFEAPIYKVSDDADGLGAPVRVALMGDSHAMSMAVQMRVALAEEGQGLRVLARLGCPPVRGLLRHDSGPVQAAPCHAWNTQAFAEVLGNAQLETVVMASRLTLYLESDRFDNGEGGRELGRTERVVFDGLAHADRVRADDLRRRAIAARYRAEIHQLLAAGKRVVLVYPVPEVGWNVASEAWLRRYDSNGIEISTSAAVFAARNARAHALLDGLGAHPRLIRVRPADSLCNTQIPGRCLAVWQGQAFYRDNNHFSQDGIRKVMPDLVAAVSQGTNPSLASGRQHATLELSQRP